MKKLLLIALMIGVMSCNVTQYFEPKFTLGMAETDFENTNRHAVMAYGDENGVTVYRTYNELSKSFKFFRFKDAKLVRVAEGIYPDDYSTVFATF